MDDLANVRAPRGFGQSDGANHVDRHIEVRICDRAADVDLGGKMEHHFGAPRRDQRFKVAAHDVRLDEIERGVLLGNREVLLSASAQVVQAHHVVPLSQQAVDERRANESCCSRHQSPHLSTFLVMVFRCAESYSANLRPY